MKLYVAALSALRGDVVRTVPGVVIAENDDEAQARGIHEGITSRLPVADGWEDHIVVVQALPAQLEFNDWIVTITVQERP